MPKEGSVKFLVNIFEGTGDFELCESGSVVVSGKISMPEDVTKEILNLPSLPSKEEKDVLPLSTNDIYKELRLRGYDYKGVFQGIVESDSRGLNGKLQWNENWISYIDTMLQFSILGQNTRELYLPTRLQRIVINPKEHLEYIENLSNDNNLPVSMYRNIGIIKSGGIELRGLKASLAPRRQMLQNPKLEKYIFMPFENTISLTDNQDKCKQQALTILSHTVLENSSGALKLKLLEIGNGNSIESALIPTLKEILEREQLVSVDATLVTSEFGDVSALEANGIKIVKKDPAAGPIDQNLHLAILSDALAHDQIKLIENAKDSLKEGGFLFLEEPKCAIDHRKLAATGLIIISTQVTPTKLYLLLRPPAVVPTDAVAIQITEKSYNWVEPVKEAMKKSENDNNKLYLYVQGEELSGLVGMVNCLKQEPGGKNIRSVFIQDALAPKFSISAYTKQLTKDLVHNVLKRNVWGSFRHLILDHDTDSGKLQVEHAYVNALTRGDLSSLRWIEGPLGYYK